jgi:hypothetical protein
VAPSPQPSPPKRGRGEKCAIHPHKSLKSRKSIIQEKSFVFAVQIVKFCRQLQKYKREFVFSNQVLRSGTSIGANVEEALGGQSGRDFIEKNVRRGEGSQRDPLLA